MCRMNYPIMENISDFNIVYIVYNYVSVAFILSSINSEQRYSYLFKVQFETNLLHSIINSGR